MVVHAASMACRPISLRIEVESSVGSAKAKQPFGDAFKGIPAIQQKNTPAPATTGFLRTLPSGGDG